VSDRRNRTSITVKLQSEEFSRLLDAMKAANPDSPTTPGAFLKRAALTYCDHLGKLPLFRGSAIDDSADSEDNPPETQSSPHIPENTPLVPEEDQAHNAKEASPEAPSPALPDPQPAPQMPVGTLTAPGFALAPKETDLKREPSAVPSPAAIPGAPARPAASDVPESTPAWDSGPSPKDLVDLLDLLPFNPSSTVEDLAPTTTAKRPAAIPPGVAENLEEVRQIFVAELDQVRRFISGLYIQANDTLDWLHENFRKCMRENVDTLEDARERVKETVASLTTGFLAAQEQAANLLEKACERHSQELKRRVETLDQIPGQLRKSSDEILAAFRKHATESSEKLTKVSTSSLRVAEKLQAENFRVGLKTFLAAIVAGALIGLPAFGWLAWQNSRLATSADTWRANAEKINQYVVETLYPRMTEKERVETNDFYTRHRLPTPEEQDRARAE
jgi:hypothetical protein